MLDTTKRTIATLTAAACLGGAGWAIASSSNGSERKLDLVRHVHRRDRLLHRRVDRGHRAYGPPPGSGRQQTEVTGDAAAKITAAVLAEGAGRDDRPRSSRTPRATTPTSRSRTARGRRCA